jgi:hypothetical protein
LVRGRPKGWADGESETGRGRTIKRKRKENDQAVVGRTKNDEENENDWTVAGAGRGRTIKRTRNEND